MKQRLPARFSERLRRAGRVYFGRAQGGGVGHPPIPLHLTVRDLGDAAIATIDIESSDRSPVELVVVIPSHRLSSLRAEFAFEFTSYLQFLNVFPAGSELPIHDGIERALADADGEASLVISLSPDALPGDIAIGLSIFVERLSACMLDWLMERDRSGEDGGRLHAAQ